MNKFSNIKRPAFFLLSAFSLITMLCNSGPVNAHVRWSLDSITPPRTNSTGLKENPCGGAARTSTPAIFSGGQTINVTFEETVNHLGYYRIAFSPANDLNFDDNVLIEYIPDATSTGSYTREITLPVDVCTDCTLQVIQVMTTAPNPAPSQFYYSCADIEITDVGDTTAPMPVGNLAIQAGDSQLTISWDIPVNDLFRVIVFKSTSPVLSIPVNGTNYLTGDSLDGAEVVYTGNDASFLASSLTNDTGYYFRVFIQNPRKNYSAGRDISATPRESSGGAGGSGSTTEPASGDSGGGSVSVFWLLLLAGVSLRIIKRDNNN